MAIIILAFHAAPVHKKIFGAIDYKYKPPFGMGLDHKWLGFFQYTTGEIFARYGSGTRDPFGEYGRQRQRAGPGTRVRPPREVAARSPGGPPLRRGLDPGRGRRRRGRGGKRVGRGVGEGRTGGRDAGWKAGRRRGRGQGSAAELPS